MSHTFDLKKYKLTIPDPSVEDATRAPLIPLISVAIRDLDGDDELAAIDRAASLAPSGRAPNQTEILHEMISMALVEVNGVAVPSAPGTPWRGHTKWSAKVRDFLRVAFRGVNDANPKDIEDFIEVVRGGGGPPTPSKS